MNYLKTFATLADYEAYVSTPHPQPLTAYIEATDEVIFEPLEDGEEKNWLQSIELKDATGSGSFTETIIFTKNMKSLDIPSTVTSIGIQAFADCVELEEITIPSNVTSLGAYLFQNCSKLKNVDLGSGITSIAQNCFQNCTSLKKIVIPASVTSIGSAVFANCTKIEDITVESGNTVYDSRDNCKMLIITATNKLLQGVCGANVVIPNSVTTSVDYCFGNFTIGNLTIGTGLTNIVSYFMYYCTLDSLTMLATTPPTIYNDSFYYSSITKIYVPAESVEAYKTANIWQNWSNKIEAIPSV